MPSKKEVGAEGVTPGFDKDAVGVGYYESVIKHVPTALLIQRIKTTKGEHATECHCVIKTHYKNQVFGLCDDISMCFMYEPDGITGPYVKVVDDNDVIKKTRFRERFPDKFDNMAVGLECLFGLEFEGITFCKTHLLGGSFNDDINAIVNCAYSLRCALLSASVIITEAYRASPDFTNHGAKKLKGRGGPCRY